VDKVMRRRVAVIVQALEKMPTDERADALNEIRKSLHEVSPFRDEPVDCVLWERHELVAANDYNPNSVAPPEMQLLQLSIESDGYTQPVVAWRPEPDSEDLQVVDGFHRTRCAKEVLSIQQRVHGRVPVAVINTERTERNDRIASTIRHNRARGKHAVSAMSDIVIELKRRNWRDERIARELGMDQDEILRLCQITGLGDLFSDSQFSQAWDVEGHFTEDDFEELTDDVGDEVEGRTVNTSDENRVFHTYDKWECYKAGFYATTCDMKKPDAEREFAEFIKNTEEFGDALNSVIKKWTHSCEHYLTNVAMNRLAWLGQAAVCYATGIPSAFRAGWFLLTEDEQRKADEQALEALNRWAEQTGRDAVSMEEAAPDRQSVIY